MPCSGPVDLVAFVKGELANGERASAESHLAACPDCREEARALTAVLGQVATLPGVEPDPGFTLRVMRTARARYPEIFAPAPEAVAGEPRWREVLRRLFAPAPAWAVSLAAHLLVFAVLSCVFLYTPPAPREPLPVIVSVGRPAREAPAIQWGSPTKPSGGPSLARIAARPEEEAPEIETTPERVSMPPSRPPEPPVRYAPEGAGRMAVPALVRVEDRRILAFVEGRADARKRREALARGGGDGTEEAVERALRWLASVQEPDGGWDPARFDGQADYRTGVTGLTTLSFLGAGHTHRGGPFRETVAKAVRRLVADQQADGSLGAPAGNAMYNHALGTLALLEAYCQTDDEALKPVVAAAVGFTQFAQNASGGWGYSVRDGASDASVTGWQVMALELGRAKGFLTAASSLRQAMEWIDSVTDAEGRVGYREPGQFPNGPAALTAVGMFTHLLVAPVRDTARLDRQAALLAAEPPTEIARPGREMRNDFYGWTFTTLALFQRGGPAWERWNAAMKPALLGAQEKSGMHAGSWGPIDRWSGFGGRLYATASAALILETYYRYPRLVR
jgi:anti-sigma factor RsiW